MTRLYLDLGPSFAANISTQRNALSEAITATLEQHTETTLKRAGMAPAVTLVSSLVTVSGAHAAVFEVENLNDSGPGSLRQAVVDANNNPGPDAITFGDGVTGTVTLTSGEIDIYESLIVQGPGEASLTIDGNDNSRIFDIQPFQNEQSFEFRDMTLANGSVSAGLNRGVQYSGGAIRLRSPGVIPTRGGGANYYSRLTLNSVTLSNSSAYDDGGALYADGAFVEIIDSTINDNYAGDDGGGVKINEGAVTISGTGFDNNYAVSGGGGIAVNGAFSVFVGESTFTNNFSDYNGGAIYLDSIEVNAAIANSTLYNNEVDDNGGGVFASDFNNGAVLEINNTSITGNYANSGAGIYAYDVDLHILNNSVVSNNNSEGQGGGVLFKGELISLELRIEDSTIDNNTAGQRGGGLFFYAEEPSLLVRNSSISGNSAAYGGGIAIFYDGGDGNQYGTITLDNATINGNSADVGGGVFMEVEDAHSPILITDSDISNNYAQEDDGGGLFMYFDDGLYTSLIIRNTVIDGNYAAGAGGGLWFYDDDGYNVVIENSTISNNTANENGGGVRFYSDDGAPIIRNSTISGNASYANGGGLYLTHEDGDGRIENSTIVNNYAYENGGGIFNANSELYIRSSIVANNSTGGTYSEIAGDEVYAQFSLIENLDGFNLSGNNNNIFYTDPMLGPLASNGGPTMTHALLAGSPAIDAGLNSASSADDQRGQGFERMIGLQTDMGAVESTTDDPLSFPAYTQLVTNLYDAGAGSLRQAVLNANTTYGLDVIEFQAGLNGTITLTSGDIDIYDSLVINAPVPSVITVSGGFNPAPEPARGESYERIFTMRGGVTPERGGPGDPAYNLLSVDIVGLTLTNGLDENGGAIYANSTELTIRDSLITNNTANGYYSGGGGIDQYRGVLRIVDSTISDNVAQNTGSDGGGIRIENASLEIRNSSLTGNSATDDAGALQLSDMYATAIAGSMLNMNQTAENGGAIDIDDSYGSIVIADSTIDGNTSGDDGGGISQYGISEYGDALTLDNTTVSNNVVNGEGSDGGGIFVSDEGRNLFIRNNSLIDNNSASNGGGIAFLGDDDGTLLIIEDSTVSNNDATNDGGGLYLETEEAFVGIINSTFSGNTANADGGGIAIYGGREVATELINTTISGNTAGDAGGGFYLYVYESASDGPIVIEDSRIVGNMSQGDGGGIFMDSDGSGLYGGVTIRNSTVANNMTLEGGSGGGIFITDDESNYAFVIDNTTVSGNSATDSGGGLFIYTEDANLFVRNSTFSGNTAGGNGGGLSIDYLDNTAFIANSTITGNSSGNYGGGIYSNDIQINVLGSIISGNTAEGTGDDLYLNGGQAGLVFSILGSAAVNAYDNAFNAFYADPLLAPLANNGGPTETHALMAGSPAINRGFNFVASTTDQRLTGFPRTIGGLTDMGAFEANANPILSLAVAGSPFAENGGMATIDASSTEAVGETTFIDLTFGGVAILDTDFMVDSNTLVVSAGTDMSINMVTMTGIDDPIFEGDEGIDITGNSSRGPAPLMADAVITDDDPEPTVVLSLAGSPINEGGNAMVTATLSEVSGVDTTVNLAISGTATPVTDFGLPTTIMIPAGMTSADITLTTVDDAQGEADETVIVDIDSVVNGVEDGVQQVTATILDNDEPSVSLSLVGDPIPENGGMSTITATLSNLSDLDVTANLAFSGTATNGVDFTVPGSIVVPNGMLSADVVLNTIDDGLDEGDETVLIDIDSVVNGTENGVQQVMTTITDDDGTLVSVSLSVTEVDEGGNADVILTLDTVAGNDIDIELGFSGTAMMPDDYTVSSTMLTIPTGQTTGMVQLMVNMDLVADPNETVIIDIINVVGGAEDGEQQATLIIRDAPVEVPTLSSVGKWLMALLLPLAALFGLRRRQTK